MAMQLREMFVDNAIIPVANGPVTNGVGYA